MGGNLKEKNQYAFTTDADLSGLTVLQTVGYDYSDASWKDKLTSFNDKPITYDPTDKPSDYNSIGNPLTYDGWTYTWMAGRMLSSMVRRDANDVITVNAQFTYDHTGLRVKKSVNGVDTLYTLNGKKITHIRKGTSNATGTDAVQMHFVCDAQGRPMLVRYMGTDYAYLHNLQGDVVGIVNMNGATVVVYRYDAWGTPILTEGSMAETLGRGNPFRYRGYVWDEETGLYYLRSRYYEPDWGRFVNADGEIHTKASVFDAKLLCYCKNNPVRYVDDAGTSFWDVLKEIATVVLAVAVVVVVVAVVAGTGGGAGFALAGGGALAGAATAATEAAVVTAAAATTVYGAAALGQTVFLASSAGKMQRDVERGRAPREVDRVDDPHPGAQESHVHFKDGTALNQSGTLHDKMHGVPKLTKPLIKWLRFHEWATKIRFK